jgi:hypothetical protein
MSFLQSELPAGCCSLFEKEQRGWHCADAVLILHAFVMLQLLEAVTKFAVVRIAITGEPLMEGCKGTTELLSRNLLDTVSIAANGAVPAVLTFLHCYLLLVSGICSTP